MIYNSDIPEQEHLTSTLFTDAQSLRVEGIETWILTLQVPIENVDISGPFLRVIDPKTKAVFEIRRVE